MTMNRHQWIAMPVAFAAAVLRPALILLTLVFPLAVGPQQRTGSPPPVKSAAPGTVTANVVEAANQFLAALTDAERSKCTFSFTSSQRTGWSNLPTGIFQRNGLRFGDMTSPQRETALGLGAAALSREGYQKVTDIINGDEVLKNAGGGRTGGRQGGAGRAVAGGRGGGVRFGLDEYYIALLGTPSATAAWMIQFGGHHLAINVTVVGPNTVMTPSLPAAQPAKYILNGQTIRPLGRENDKGFALINALNAAQQKHAILNYEVKDLVLGPGADGKVIQPEGILASDLDANQQALLFDVVLEWVGILNDEAAAAKMAEIKANLPRTYFAWRVDPLRGAPPGRLQRDLECRRRIQHVRLRRARTAILEGPGRAHEPRGSLRAHDRRAQHAAWMDGRSVRRL